MPICTPARWNSTKSPPPAGVGAGPERPKNQEQGPAAPDTRGGRAFAACRETQHAAYRVFLPREANEDSLGIHSASTPLCQRAGHRGPHAGHDERQAAVALRDGAQAVIRAIQGTNPGFSTRKIAFAENRQQCAAA